MKNPYMLKCLQETLHNHNYSDESIEDAKALENGNNGTDNENIQKNENLFLNWPLMSSIIAYCIFSLHDITYLEVRYLMELEIFFTCPYISCLDISYFFPCIFN